MRDGRTSRTYIIVALLRGTDKQFAASEDLRSRGVMRRNLRGFMGQEMAFRLHVVWTWSLRFRRPFMLGGRFDLASQTLVF